MPFPLTGTAADVNTGVPVQVVSAGLNALNVIDPLGVTPSDSVAESEILPPAATDAEVVVTRVGVTTRSMIGTFGAAGLSEPTPVQLFTRVQDTPPRLPVTGDGGVATMLHVAPSHCSTSAVLPLVTPTAMQLAVVGQETALRKLLVAPLGDTSVHVTPSHFSIRMPPDAPEVKSPAAVQLVADGQDTPNSSVTVEAAGTGNVAILQVVPLICSITAAVPEPVTNDPTAVQLPTEVQDTPFRPLVVEVGLGETAVDQVVPFHCSTSVF